MKLTATKEVAQTRDIDRTTKDLDQSKCDYTISNFKGTVIFTIHDYSDFVMHQVEFNDFLLSSTRN